MKRRKIIPYNPKLKKFAQKLRNASTKSEVLLWLKLKGKQMHGYDFHRQKPLNNFIVDFFCHELMLAIELDGYSHELLDIYYKDVFKEKILNTLGVEVLHFTDNQVLKDMSNVLNIIDNYIIEFEKHTPA